VSNRKLDWLNDDRCLENDTRSSDDSNIVANPIDPALPLKLCWSGSVSDTDPICCPQPCRKKNISWESAFLSLVFLLLEHLFHTLFVLKLERLILKKVIFFSFENKN